MLGGNKSIRASWVTPGKHSEQIILALARAGNILRKKRLFFSRRQSAILICYTTHRGRALPIIPN